MAKDEKKAKGKSRAASHIVTSKAAMCRRHLQVPVISPEGGQGEKGHGAGKFNYLLLFSYFLF